MDRNQHWQPLVTKVVQVVYGMDANILFCPMLYCLYHCYLISLCHLAYTALCYLHLPASDYRHYDCRSGQGKFFFFIVVFFSFLAGTTNVSDNAGR